MALTKEQKTKQIESIKEKVKQQKSVIFVDFNKVQQLIDRINSRGQTRLTKLS